MNKKDILIIISVVGIAAIIGGIFLYVEQKNTSQNTNIVTVNTIPTSTVSDARTEEEKDTDAFCASSTYIFLDLDIITPGKCINVDSCFYYDVENAMNWMKKMYGNDLLDCSNGKSLWSPWSHASTDIVANIDSRAYIKVRNDFYLAFMNELNKKIFLDDGLTFKIVKTSEKIIPYLLDNKYCESSSDCIVSFDGCTSASYNEYSIDLTRGSCDENTQALRTVTNSVYYDEVYKDYIYKFFKTIQLGCINNRCEEKYILDETGEEF